MAIDFKTSFRPKSFKAIAGNTVIKKSIKNAIDSGTLQRTILFHGDSGCGKTTLGRVIGLKMGVDLGVDFHELDNAIYTGKDDINEILSNIALAPLVSPYKVYLLDECHNLSPKAQETLLKRLENPPKHVIFILCTTEPTKLKPTLRGRCTEYKVKALTKKESIKFINKIAKKAELEISEVVTDALIEVGNNKPRDMLTLMSMLPGIDDDIEAITLIKDSLNDDVNVFNLTMTLIKQQGNNKAWVTACKDLVLLKPSDAEGIRRSILGICNTMLLKAGGRNTTWSDKIFYVMDAMKDSFFYTGKPGLTRACYDVLYQSSLYND